MTTLIREAASRCFFLFDPTVRMVVAGPPRSKNRSEDYLPRGVKYTANGFKRN